MRLINYSPDYMEFMYKTRCHPEVDAMLTGKPPECFEEHVNYLTLFGHNYYVMLDEKTPVAYSQIKHITDDMCEVGFVVHPDYQGMGYGNRLIKLTLDRTIINYPKIVLFVFTENHRAIHLYDKFGFEITNQIGKEYRMVNSSWPKPLCQESFCTQSDHLHVSEL